MSALESVTDYSNISSYEIFDRLTGVDLTTPAHCCVGQRAGIVGGARQGRDRGSFAHFAREPDRCGAYVP